MKPFSSSNHRTLTCLQPKAMSRQYEVHSTGEVIGTLRFESAFGTLATAETADGGWTFKRVGFLKPQITVREIGKEENAAVYEPRLLGGGVLTLKDNKTLNWRSTGFWGSRWSFVIPPDYILLSLSSGVQDQRVFDLFKTQATVELHPTEALRPNMCMLSLLAMYLLVLEQEETSVAAAV